MVAQDMLRKFEAALDVNNSLSIKMVLGKTVTGTSLVNAAGGIVVLY